MPVYDYKCEECGNTHEVWLIKTTSALECPECGDTENQTRIAPAPARAYATQDDYPKNNKDLASYVGNGKYLKGYKR